MIALDALNSMTKYPSIPTYHKMGDRGALLDEHLPLPQDVVITEKVDGTNSRIILMQDGRYFIGSRETLLHCQGDVIFNPAQGIVEALRPLADVAGGLLACPVDGLKVLYLEVFGGKITRASKQYTGRRAVGYRLFDVAEIHDMDTLGGQAPEAIARWRDDGGQQFYDEDALRSLPEAFADAIAAGDRDVIPPLLTPRIAESPDVPPLPTAHADVLAWLKELLPDTQCRLDDDAGGNPEGVVVRTPDRSSIVKVRVEDYERHLRRR